MQRLCLCVALLGAIFGVSAVHGSTPERPLKDVSPVVLVVPDVVVERAQLTLMPMHGLWHHEGQPFSGYAERYYSSGAVSEHVGFVQGKREGVASVYYPDGSLRKRSFYRRNRLNGVAHFWSSEGTLLSETYYVGGVIHGTQKLWYPDGNQFKHRNLAYGREHGMQRAWRRSGKLYINYEARNGRVFGLKRSTLCFSLEDEKVVKK